MLTTNDEHSLLEFRAVITSQFEILSLADVAMPEPAQAARSLRQSAMLAASLVSSHSKLPAIGFVRSFTIEPLFEYDPDPQSLRVGTNPNWTWQLLPRQQTPAFVESVIAANRYLYKGGYCGPDDRGAYFLTTLCFMTPGGDPRFFEEWCGGQFYLYEDAMTADGIDFTKCLIPTGQTKTLAELHGETRARLSDFRKAAASLNAWLLEQP